MTSPNLSKQTEIINTIPDSPTKSPLRKRNTLSKKFPKRETLVQQKNSQIFTSNNTQMTNTNININMSQDFDFTINGLKNYKKKKEPKDLTPNKVLFKMKNDKWTLENDIIGKTKKSFSPHMNHYNNLNLNASRNIKETNKNRFSYDEWKSLSSESTSVGGYFRSVSPKPNDRRIGSGLLNFTSSNDTSNKFNNLNKTKNQAKNRVSELFDDFNSKDKLSNKKQATFDFFNKEHCKNKVEGKLRREINEFS